MVKKNLRMTRLFLLFSFRAFFADASKKKTTQHFRFAYEVVVVGSEIKKVVVESGGLANRVM